MSTSVVRQFVAITFAVCLFALPNHISGQTNEATDAPRFQTLGVVNGQSISRQEVSNECMRRYGEEVIETLVNKMLVYEECQKRGIAITEQDINDVLTADAAKLGFSAERYIQIQCEKRGISADRLKRDVMWSELALRRLAESQTQVTPEEIQQRLAFEFGEKIRAQQLVVSSREKAEQLHAAAVADPASFERICKEHSIDPNSASMGGMLPPIRQNSGFPQFENIAFSLQPGEISPVFEVESQFVVLKCQSRIPPSQLGDAELDAVNERIRTEISRTKHREAAVMIFETLQKGAEIVNVMNDETLRRQNPGVAATVNGNRITIKQVSEECIAQFGKNMLALLISNKILEQALQSSGLQLSDSETEAAIAAELELAAEMHGMVANGKPQVKEFLNLVTQNDPSKIEFFIQDVIWADVAKKRLVENQVQVTEEDIQKSFEANYGPRVEVRAMMFRDQRQATEKWEMATKNPNEEFFGQLANQYSFEPVSRNNFGHIQPIQRYSGNKALEEVAFKLQPNEISRVTQVGDFWVILYCRGRTTPRVTNVDDVREYIVKDVRQRKIALKMHTLQKQLLEDAQIDNYLNGTSQPGRNLIRQAKKQ